jgi:hypothetical protein
MGGMEAWRHGGMEAWRYGGMRDMEAWGLKQCIIKCDRLIQPRRIHM